MKHSIDTYIASIVHDNAEFILQGGYASVADYIITTADNGTGYYEFFDDCELGEEGEPTDEQVDEIKDHLRKLYNFLPQID